MNRLAHTLALTLVTALLLVVRPAAAQAAVQETLYVSPSGTGTTCTSTAPCALTTARDRVRADNDAMTGDIVVQLAGGIYALGSTFTLAGADSGSNGYRVIYQNAPGAAPVLSGGVQISGWTLHDATKNIYAASVPSALETRQLYVNSVRAVRARSATLAASAFTETSTGWTANNPAFATMASWGDLGQVELWGYKRWRSFRCAVEAMTGTAVDMVDQCWHNAQVRAGTVYDWDAVSYVENAYELLDSAGEFYLDRGGDVVYYIPRSGENMSSAQVFAPALQTVLRAAGTAAAPVHHVTFRGISFAHATWLGPEGPNGFAEMGKNVYFSTSGTTETTELVPGNVTFTYAYDVTIEGCRFSRLGGSGLSLGTGTHDVSVLRNTISDVSGTGLLIGDLTSNPSATLQASDIVVEDNLIELAGRDYQGAAGLFAPNAANLSIRHNLVRNLPLDGIMIGWHNPATYGTVLVENNEVHTVGTTLYDVGGIHTLHFQPDTVIRGNYVHGVGHDADTANNAIYLDNDSSAIEVPGNVVHDTRAWLNLWDDVATDNVVTGNYTDDDLIACAVGSTVNYPGDSPTCNGQHDNIITGTVEVPDQNWPAAAQSIIDNAGVR
ncbi:right-handed parallel beta-helix repeat-containing protein [Plantactinospora sp. ZYX-F-223]|uniref:right-handed parallel beta-helix repeat-containing protein n=1 Tax=Plantactinospora sp. ZYX-F-223 TaxID=3144103 RepID=UPI0031FC9EA4